MKPLIQKRLFSFILLIMLIATPIISSIPNAFGLITSVTGGTITFAEGYQIHTFTSSGTFTIVKGQWNVQYLVIAGGGGGGGSSANAGGGGGGGAGGTLNGTLSLGVGAYTVTIGAGGGGGGSSTSGTSGSNSVFSSITSTGGGGGGKSSSVAGLSGGSGGGGGAVAGTGGAGTANQGYAGGGSNGNGAGGGGGADTDGVAGTSPTGGNGGTGALSSFSGSAVGYAAGGGGGLYIGAGDVTNGGGGVCSGITGGAGGTSNNGHKTGDAAAANTGCGGGGAGNNNLNGFAGGNGGSGKVIVRFADKAPDKVDDLSFLHVTGNSAILDWSAPDTGIPITGYQINYTTPWSNPLTILVDNTGSIITQGSVSGLTELTQYSFRVSARTVENDINATGNIANTTTLKDFSFGSLNLTVTNPNRVPFLFERDDINDTALFLNFTYSSSFTSACDLHYKYAQTNRTYHNIASTTSGTTKHSAFQFNNIDNEVVDVFCWNQSAGNMLNNTNVNSSNSGRYIITQTQFLLLDQVRDFKAGKYGTEGNFGVIDLVTLIVIIMSLVGLNRINESVGGFFLVGIVGVAWYFGIISLLNFIISAIALVLLLIVGTTKKD